MAIKLTETAVKELKRVITEQQLPDAVALRIGVAGGGCSGFEYTLAFDENVREETGMLTEVDGVRVAVDKKSALYLDGTQIPARQLRASAIGSLPAATRGRSSKGYRRTRKSFFCLISTLVGILRK